MKIKFIAFKNVVLDNFFGFLLVKGSMIALVGYMFLYKLYHAISINKLANLLKLNLQNLSKRPPKKPLQL